MSDPVLSPSLRETIAGFTAGVVSTLTVHPLDVIKTRLQVDRTPASRLGSSWRIARDIAHNEGSVAAFYRGLTPNHGPERGLSYYDYFIASGAAGALTAICTNPIWVIKTRMLSTSSKHAGAYTSVLDGTRHIYRSEGFSGFYRGLVPSLFGVSHGAFQFTAYEQLKNYRASGPVEAQKDLTNVDYLWLSGLSKIFAGTITYPYQVVRARLQTYDADKTYRSARDVVLQVRRQEGWGGFYKGLGPNLLRVVPSTCVTFLVYENARYYLPRAFDNMQQS